MRLVRVQECFLSLGIRRKIVDSQRHLSLEGRLSTDLSESAEASLPLQHRRRGVRTFDGEWVVGFWLWRDGGRRRIDQALGHRLLPEGAGARERRVLHVERHRHGALLVASLFTF